MMAYFRRKCFRGTILSILSVWLICVPYAGANQEVSVGGLSSDRFTLSNGDIGSKALVPDSEKKHRLHPTRRGGGNVPNPVAPSLTPESIINALKAKPSGRQTVAINADQRQNLRSLVGNDDNKVNARVKFNNKNGTPRMIKIEGQADKKAVNSAVAQAISIDAAGQFLSANRALLKIQAPEDEFAVKKKWTDNIGTHHVRYQQQYQGMPVWGKEALVHMDGSNQVYMFQGSFEPTPVDAKKVFNIQEDQAIAAAYSHMGIAKQAPEEVKSIAPVWYTRVNGRVVSAYAIEVQPRMDQYWVYFIDGHDGEVLHRISLIATEVIETSGADLHDITQNFTAWRDPGSGQQNSIDPTLPLDDQPYAPWPMKDFGNTYIFDARNQGGPGEQFDIFLFSGPNWDPAAVSMAYHIELIDAYWKNTFDRNGIDDNNMNYFMVGNVGDNYGNAFWNGMGFFFGSGDEVFSNLAGSFDVTAHEYTHGVIRATANLLYENQSGALNEAFADLFACMVDRHDWIVGEDITLVPPFYIRNLIDPSEGLTPLPTKMSEYENLPVETDHGGVHINCGIPARAGYLMAEGLSTEDLGTSIGRDKTEQIWYRALTVYLTQTSEFIDAREAMIQAALDLYGAEESASVQAAWDAVEVLGDGNEPSEPNDPTPTDPVAGDDMMVYLRAVAGSDDAYDVYAQQIPMTFSEGDTTSVTGPLNVSSPASYMRPSAITVEGDTGIFYVGTDHNLYMIFPDGTDMEIPSAEDIHSMAISPDGKYFACTMGDFTDENGWDNRIWIGDLVNSTMTEYELVSPSTAPGDVGIQNTVMFADSLSFDYTSNTLVFDAFNKMVIGSEGDEYTYWTIGCLDLNTGHITWPFPNQNPNFDIGNASFAYNNSFVVAFDVFDHSTYPADTWVWTMNLETQTVKTVANANPDNYSGFDGLVCGVPSFWGDDDAITMQVFYPDSDSLAYKIPLDGDWGGLPNQAIELNDQTLVKPIMHRAGNRALVAVIDADKDACTFNNGDAFQEVVVANNGNRDIRIYSVAITGPGEASFRHDGVNGLIPRGQQKTINVFFEPSVDADGSQAATLVVRSDADAPLLEVSLTGNAGTGGGGTGGGGSGGSGGGGGGGCFISAAIP